MLKGHEQTTQRLAYLQASKALSTFLAKITAIRFVGFVPEEELIERNHEIWRHIVSFDTQPTMTIRIQHSDDFNWFANDISSLNLDNRCYISFGGSSLPWVEISLIDTNWPHELANTMESLDLIIMNPKTYDYIAVTEEEYEYYVFININLPEAT